VAAGHDQFAMDLVGRIFSGRRGFLDACDVFCADLVRRVVKMAEPDGDLAGIFVPQSTLNLTHLALNSSDEALQTLRTELTQIRDLLSELH
jgi:hypothetical protein